MAGIPMLAGWADGLSSLPQLGQSLATIMNPNSDIQHLFKQKAATDPNFLQNLANNPQAAAMLKQLGFGDNIQNSVSAIPEDATSIAAGDKAKLLSEAINNPQLRADAQAVAVTGQPTSSLRTQNVRANVAEATQGSDIAGTIATNKKAINDATTSDQDLQMREDTLKAIPNLAGIDISKVNSDIVNNRPVNPNILSRIAMDPTGGSQKALAAYQQAYLAKMELMSRQTIAEIQRNKPQNQLFFLQYAKGQQDVLNKQLEAANGFLKSIDPKQEILWNSLSSSKDTSDAGKALRQSAIDNLARLKEARDALAPNSTLHKQLDNYNTTMQGIIPSLMKELGGNVGGSPVPAPGGSNSTSTRTTTSEPISLLPQQVSGFVSAIKSGTKTMADLNNFHAAGGISDNDYQTILSQISPMPGAASIPAPSVAPPVTGNPFQIRR